jgi:MFS family permease
VSLVSLLLALSKGRDWGWGGPVTITLLGVGGLALVAFIWFERRVREPLVDLHLITSRGVWAVDLISVLLGFAMFGTFLLVPTLVQLPAAPGPGFGATASEAGLLLLPTTLMMLVFAPIAGKLVARVGPRPPMLGGAFAVVVAFLLLAYAHDAVWHIVVSGALTGAGIGLAFAAMPNVLIDAVPASHTAEATSVNTVARTIGSSIGTAAIAAVISSGTGPPNTPSDRALSAGFLVCAGVAALAVVASFLVPPARHHGNQAGASDPTHASDATVQSRPQLG